MSDVPIQIVVAAFNSPDGATRAMKALKDAQGAGLVTIDNAAILTKDTDGKLEIKEPSDWGGGRGAVIGGVTGAAVGLLAGPVGWAVGLGALVGGLAAKLRDSGFSDARLRKLGESLKPGSSALVAVVEHRWVEQLEKQLVEEGADTLTEQIGSDIATQLEAGRDVAYTALSAAGVAMTARTSVGADTMDVSSLVVTPEEAVMTWETIKVEPDDGAPATTGDAAIPEPTPVNASPAMATPTRPAAP